MRTLSLPLAVLASLHAAFAADVSYQLNVVNAAVSPDGFSRQGVLINGIFPGTTITANKGDTLLLNVANQLTNPTMRRSTTIVSFDRHCNSVFVLKIPHLALAWPCKLVDIPI
jgi:iron transport multicopper oxidase